MPEQPERTHPASQVADERLQDVRPDGAAQQDAHRRGWRVFRGRGSLTAALLLGLLGFALSTSSLDPQRGAVRELTEAEMVELLHDVEQHDSELDAQRRALEEQKAELAAGRDSSAAERQARERSQELGILAGVLPAAGPGIQLTIPGGEGIGAPVLLDAVQELRDAGAEAMEVNGHRVVASSSFVEDAEGRVVMDGERLAPPYRLKAIGPGDTMATAMRIPGGIVESAKQDGASVTVVTLDEVRVESTVPLPE
ncbi:DUF881 domain-containing protein [Kytococcus sp. Marseille-QA3725]